MRMIGRFRMTAHWEARRLSWSPYQGLLNRAMQNLQGPDISTGHIDMKFFSYRFTPQVTSQVAHQVMPRRLILIIIAGATLMFSPMTMATEAVPPEGMAVDNLSMPEKNDAGRVGLSVSGMSAGLTTEYFEQAVTDTLVTSGIFSDIDNSRTADVVMPMIGVSGTFPGIKNNSSAQYLLKIRILKVDTPSFSIRMTVGMKAIWTLYDAAGKTELLHEKINSTYTGGVFEGGVIGANRVRVAMEGAARENIHIGMGMLESMSLGPEQHLN